MIWGTCLGMESLLHALLKDKIQFTKVDNEDHNSTVIIK